MKNLTKTISLIAPMLLAALMLGSCVKEHLGDGRSEPKEDAEKTVRFAMRVPGASDGTRALTGTQEDEVDHVAVLVVNPSTGNVFKHEIPSGEITSGGGKRIFEVTLPVGTYNLVVLANANDLIREKYPNGIAKGTDLESVMNSLIVVRQETMAQTGDRPGDKWNTTVDATKKYLIPMWGQLSNVQVKDAPAEDQEIGTVNIYRMVAKIDVRIPRTKKDGTALITETNFKLTQVTFHNYNTKGQLMPTYSNGDWETNGGGKASAPTVLPATDNFIGQHDKYQLFGSALIQAYTPPATDKVNPEGTETGLVGEIYTFEAGKGSAAGTRPCVIIGGSYKGGSTTYYRADLVRSGTKEYLNLLRNHRYIVWVKKISGPGYGSVEDAYKSAPINLEAEVIPWDEGEFLEGVWNGNNFIKFNTMEASFTQFAEPTPQVIRIKTDCPDLTFGNFTNIAKGSADGDWTESPAGTWSNGHFTVEAAKGATVNGITEYTLTVTATPTTGVATDPARESQFLVKGLNLEAQIVLKQDAHVQWRLICSPDPDIAIMRNGAEQRIRIDVTSTHEYEVVYNNTTMITGVWNEQYGGQEIGKTHEPTRKTIYVALSKYESMEPRIAEFTIRHTSSSSEASSVIYKVIQVSPTITAQVKGGGYTGSVPRGGGSIEIEVKSNMNAWTPVLYEVNTDNSRNDLNASLGSYFDIVNGNTNATVKFNLGRMSESVTEAKKYVITFKDADGDTESKPAIEITHKATTGTPPKGGVRAEEYILSVDEKGTLNLDGKKRPNNWIVYFRFNSVIGISPVKYQDPFDNSDIAWVPENFTGDISAINTWEDVPYGASGDYVLNPSQGIGDPCLLAEKDGVVGKYITPTGTTYPQAPALIGSTWSYENGSYGHWYNYQEADQQFYPAAGFRQSQGYTDAIGTHGDYWSATPNGTNAYRLYFHSGAVNKFYHGPRTYAMPIRCVRIPEPGDGGGGTPPTSGIRAEEDVLAVNSKGQLNLDGEGYMVYFKFNSAIAVSGGVEGDEFDNSDIAWVPKEFATDYTTIATWGFVPMPNDKFWHENLSKGFGDPCKLAVKNGVAGEYRLPTYPYEQGPVTANGKWSNSRGVDGHWYNYGQPDQQFYPAAGCRNYSTGICSDTGEQGMYWSSGIPDWLNGNYMYFNHNSVSTAGNPSGTFRAFGMAVRCIKK